MPVLWIALFSMLWLTVLILIILVLGLSERLTAAVAEGRVLALREAPLTLGGVLPIGTRIPRENELLSPSPNRGRTAILFLSSSCGPCRTLSDRLLADATDSRRPGALNSDDELVVVTDPAGVKLFAGLGRVVVEHDREFGRALGVSSTPMGFGVERDGTLRAVNLIGDVRDVIQLVSEDSASLTLTVSAPTHGPTPSHLLNHEVR